MLKNTKIWSEISKSFKENITTHMDFIEINDYDKFIHLKKIYHNYIVLSNNIRTTVLN